ncbi:Multimeric flavodoxin WrbA [Lachnospiraceae bacterium]|nr:Multimeric flavodoxin WrbA [Lachnospiraceae bacterium]
MHAVIINGSPRVKQFSNTDKIISKFAEGFCRDGNTYELYSISDRREWDDARKAYYNNFNIIIALPLYVECVPGLLMEFLETLTPKNEYTQISYILQGGFAEGSQLRCGQDYMKILTKELGCSYGGTLVKGDNFYIRFADERERERRTGIYKEMGAVFSRDGDFFSDDCIKFTGPEVFSLPIRLMLGLMFKTLAKGLAEKTAAGLGCTKPIDCKPYIKNPLPEEMPTAEGIGCRI